MSKSAVIGASQIAGPWIPSSSCCVWAAKGGATLPGRADVCLVPEKARRLVVRRERIAACCNVLLAIAMIHIWGQRLIVR
jgi:hypothetical protein